MSDTDQKLRSAFEHAVEILTAFAASGGFADGRMDMAFAEDSDSALLKSIGDALSFGEAWGVPVLKMLSGLEAEGILAAYVPASDDRGSGSIYFSETFVRNATHEELVTVLLEEIGHAIDWQVNASDAPGDEGAIFAQIVQGLEIAPNTLAAF